MDIYLIGPSFFMSVCVDTFLFWNLLAGLDWDLLVHIDALFPGHICALLVRLLGTFLLWNLMADLLGHVDTHLVGHVLAHGVGHLPLLGLGQVRALLIWFLSACARNRDPDLTKKTLQILLKQISNLPTFSLPSPSHLCSHSS